MSERDETFEGGEGPCGESTMGRDSADTTGRGDGASGGVTADEIQEMMSQIPPEMLAPDLPMLLASMAAMLEEQSWRHLGLVANPVTQEVEKDLQKAKIAIDVVAFIAGQVSPLLPDAQRRDLQGKVQTLQMNFVEQSRRG